MSLETVGNAYFARVIHADVLDLSKLVVINNHFHMPRTRAVFDFVFSFPSPSGRRYSLQYVAVDDRLPPDVLEARLAKEAKALPFFASGGGWRAGITSLPMLHRWLFEENQAYASARLARVRETMDPKLAQSY